MRYRAIVGLVVVGMGACGGGDDGPVANGPTAFEPIAGAGAQQASAEQARKERARHPLSMLCRGSIVDANSRVKAGFGVDVLNDGEELGIRCWVTDSDDNTQDDSKVLDKWTADDVSCNDVAGWHFEIDERTAVVTNEDGDKFQLSCDVANG